MDKRANIAAQLGAILGKDKTKEFVFTARFLRMDGAATGEIDYQGLKLSNVRLLPTTTGNENRVLLIPKAGSYVLVTSDAGDLASLWILAADETDKIEITSGGVNLMATISDLIGALSGNLTLTTTQGAASGTFDPATIAKFKQIETAFKQIFK